MIKKTISLLSANIFSQAVSLLQGFVILRIIQPEMWGLWTALLLVQDYGRHFHIGIINGLNRQLPYYDEKGKKEISSELKNVGKTYLLIISCGLLALLFFITLINDLNVATNKGLFAIGISTFLTIQTDYNLCLMRSKESFYRISLLTSALSILSLIGLFLVYYFEYDGLCMRILFVNIIAYLISMILVGDQTVFSLKLQSIKELIVIGFPIWIASLMYIAFDTVPKIAAATLLDMKSLGIYSIALTAFALMQIPSNTIGYLYYTKFCKKYATSGDKILVLNMAFKIAIICSTINIAILIPAELTIGVAVEYFFPNYKMGVTAAKITMLSSIPYAFSVCISYYLHAVMHQRVLFFALPISSLISYGLCVLLVDFGLGISSIAYSTVISMVIYAIFISTAAFVLTRSNSVSA